MFFGTLHLHLVFVIFHLQYVKTSNTMYFIFFYDIETTYSSDFRVEYNRKKP